MSTMGGGVSAVNQEDVVRGLNVPEAPDAIGLRAAVPTGCQTWRDLTDHLEEVVNRAVALELAIMGASKECGMESYGDGLAQLSNDLTKSLRQARVPKCEPVNSECCFQQCVQNKQR